MSTTQSGEPATSTDPPARGVGESLPRGLTVVVGVIGAVVIAAGIRGAAEIVAPAMLALVLTIAVLPVGAWARRHGWPGWLATLLALVASYAILLVLIVGTVACLVKLADLLPQYARDADDLSSQAQDWLANVGLGGETTEDALESIDVGKVADLVTGLASTILGAVGSLFFLVTVMFFFVTAAPGFRPRMAWLGRTKPQLAVSLAKFVSGTQRYLVMTALFGAIVGVLDGGALWLIGVPLPLVWGFFSFITNFIPNIGFVIGIIPPALIALLDSGWQEMVLVLVIYSVLNVTIQTFIQPRYVGNTVGLSAEMTYLSLVVWTFLLDPLGALLAVPMTLLVRAFFIDADPRAAWAAPLIDAQVDYPPADPEPEPRPDPEGPAGPDAKAPEPPDARASARRPAPTALSPSQSRPPSPSA